jgi:arylsulfatase
MNRRQFLSSSVSFLAMNLLRCQSKQDRPNILLILADDMGYSDLGCYGGEIHTPNLDNLATHGVRFTQFYNAARCCPTRASLLTGLHPAQAGMRWMNGTRKLKNYYGALDKNSVTVAEVLKQYGYSNYMSGKWHVSGHDCAKSRQEKTDWPCQRGFDQFFGTLNGGGNYYNPSTLTRDNESIQADRENYYYTDAISDQTVQYIQNHHQNRPEQPFFIYTAYTAPHFPLHAPDKDIAKYRGKYMRGWDIIRQERYNRLVNMGIIDKKWALSSINPAMYHWDELDDAKQDEMDLRMAIYAAQIDIMDQGIGRIITSLKDTHQFDNTLIFFLSDNGACKETGLWGFDRGKGKLGSAESFSSYGASWANVSNTPFRRYKMYIHEGGIATPLIVHWPKGIDTKGTLCHQIGHINDLMPTCINVAGASYPNRYMGNKILPYEGKSLIPVLNHKPRDYPIIGWEHQGNRGVRKEKWKLVSLYGEAWELYNMETDRTELHDLAHELPDKVVELEQDYQSWARRCGIKPWKWPIQEYMKPLPARSHQNKTE